VQGGINLMDHKLNPDDLFYSESERANCSDDQERSEGRLAAMLALCR